MYFEDPILYNFNHEGIAFEISDNGDTFTITIQKGEDFYSITPGNTSTDSAESMVSYVRTAINFLLDEIERGEHEGELEVCENELLDISMSLEDWDLVTYENDGTYFVRRLVPGDPDSTEVCLRTEEPEEWVTNFSILTFRGSACECQGSSFKTSLPKAMMRALAFGASKQEKVCA